MCDTANYLIEIADGRQRRGRQCDENRAAGGEARTARVRRGAWASRNCMSAFEPVSERHDSQAVHPWRAVKLYQQPIVHHNALAQGCVSTKGGSRRMDTVGDPIML